MAKGVDESLWCFLIMTRPIKNINIYGRGYAAFLAAIFLKSKICDIHVRVYCDDDKSSKLESTLSTHQFFHKLLNLPEDVFFKSVTAKKSFGIAFQSDDSLRIFADAGLDNKYLGLSPVYWWAMARSSGADVDLEEYQIPAFLLKAQTAGKSLGRYENIISSLPSGYVIDKTSYACFLNLQCKRLGIEVNNVNTEKGEYQFLNEAGSECSINILTHPIGCFEEGGEFETGYQIGCELAEDAAAYECLGSLFDIKQGSIQKAMTVGNQVEVIRYTNSKAAEKQRKYRRLNHAWCNRVIRIGLASMELPELIFSEGYVLQSQLMKLLDIWPSDDGVTKSAQIFNLGLRVMFERIGEIEMGVFSKAFGSSWCQGSPLLERYARRSMLFNHSAYISEYDHDIFSREVWASLLWSMGCEPERVAPEIVQKTSGELANADARLKLEALV